MALDPNLVDRAVEEATKRAENFDYFFDQLGSPEWIEPLRERGFLSEPPEQYVDDEGFVRAPGWSESRYLARVAGVAPQRVLEVFESVETNNERVLEDFVDGALAMPVEQARRVAAIVMRWISKRERIYYLLPRKAVDLISRLARDAPDTAVDLLRVLLAPLPAVREHDWIDSPQARFSEWEYDLHLRKIVSEAVPAAPREFLGALVQLLRDALTLLRESSESREDDLSRVWRTRVDNDRDRATEVEEALTSAVRDAAVDIRKHELLNDRELVELLTPGPDELLRRIAMHALAREPEADLDVVRPFVLNVEELTDAEPSPEFQELLSATARRLTVEEIAVLTEAVFAGPDVEPYREMSEKFDGQPPTDEQTEAFVARWRIARLALMRDALPAGLRAEYDALVAKHGEAQIPLSWEVRTFVGPNSPLSTEELAAKSDDELLTYLREWKRADRWDNEPSVEGLARAMSVVTERDPERMSRLAPQLQGIAPAYVQWILDGFEAAIREGRSFDWSPVLELLTWVVAQPREIPGGRGDTYADLDPGWVWTRREIADLLEGGLNDRGACAIPFSERERIWHVIAAVTDDPDPTPEHEERYGGQNMDPTTLSLNTARPRGLRAAIAYAIWVHHHLVGDELSSEGFVEQIPGVKDLLEAHLDPERDPSTSVRAVFGQHYANLFALDNDWAAEIAPSIFPAEDSALREAGWGSYVIYTTPYNNVLEVLQDVYRRAAELAASEGHGFRWMSDPTEKLGEHIATFLWRGVVTLDDELFTVFWSNAPATARGHMVDFLGKSAREAPLTPEVQERLTSFWSFAKENVRPDEEAETLRGFAWWFGARELPSEWRLTEANELVKAKIQPEPAFVVAEELPAMADEHPKEVLQVLGLLIEGGDLWAVDAWREHIEDVLRTALRSDDADANRLAERMVDSLLARGHRNFRTLVRTSA